MPTIYWVGWIISFYVFAKTTNLDTLNIIIVTFLCPIVWPCVVINNIFGYLIDFIRNI